MKYYGALVKHLQLSFFKPHLKMSKNTKAALFSTQIQQQINRQNRNYVNNIIPKIRIPI